MSTGLKEVYRASIDLHPWIDVGPVPGGYRRIMPIKGGRIEGERIRAEILPFGADWNLLQPDYMMFVSARYCIKTDDGAFISILNEGYNRLNEDVVKKLEQELPPPADFSWYGRTQPRFEVADPRYKWLTESVFVMEQLAPKDPSLVELVCYELT
jgi:hypothetical protein